MKKFMIALMAMVFGIIGGLSLAQSDSQAQTIHFDQNMVNDKNLTYHGQIKVYVNSSAKKYNSDVNYSLNKWNKALGKKFSLRLTAAVLHV